MAEVSSLLDTGPKSLLDKAKTPGTVYLLRHGRTALDVARRSDGWLDLPLSDDGQLSLIEAQQHLKLVPLSKIYAPDLKRTHESAKIVASGTLSNPTVVEADEAKTWNLGVLAGTKKEEGRPKVKALMQNPDMAPPGGESINDFKARFLPWFEKTVGAAKGKPILIVCSGSNLRCLGAELFGNEDALDLDEGGLVALSRTGGYWQADVVCGAKDSSQYES